MEKEKTLGRDYGLDFRLEEVVDIKNVTSDYYYPLLNCTNTEEREMHVREILENCPKITIGLKDYPLHVIGVQIFDNEYSGALLYDSKQECMYPISDRETLEEVGGLIIAICFKRLIDIRNMKIQCN